MIKTNILDVYIYILYIDVSYNHTDMNSQVSRFVNSIFNLSNIYNKFTSPEYSEHEIGWK